MAIPMLHVKYVFSFPRENPLPGLSSLDSAAKRQNPERATQFLLMY